MIGYLARFGIGNRAQLAGAALMGAILASFTVENFSVTGLATATPQSIADRKALLQAAMQIEMQSLV